jgi:hypothetical protein
LLTGLTKQVLETALDVELSDHLGHERGERSGSGNVRNGSTQKTVRTDVGKVHLRHRHPLHTRALLGVVPRINDLPSTSSGELADALPILAFRFETPREV